MSALWGKAEVLQAASTFIARCNLANVRINDIDQYAADIDQELSRIMLSGGDWLGINYDLVSSHFATMRFLRAFGADTAKYPNLWLAAVTIPEGVAKDLVAWIDEVLPNDPVPIFDDAPSVIITVDASAWGWGAIAMFSDTGAVQEIGKEWSPQDRAAYDVQKSVYAEPLAAYKALCHFVNPNAARKARMVIRVLTDNVAAVSCINAGYSPSFNVNRVAGLIKSTFAGSELRAEHIAGRSNEADPLSRGAGLQIDGKHESVSHGVEARDPAA